APIADAGVIAVTYTWGVFGGPPRGRGVVEGGMIFDSDSFTWATDGSPGGVDFRNIDTHELGHAMGLGHPSNACTEETMYAFAALGETKKRDLNAGDIAGINGLSGPCRTGGGGSLPPPPGAAIRSRACAGSPRRAT